MNQQIQMKVIYVLSMKCVKITIHRLKRIQKIGRRLNSFSFFCAHRESRDETKRLNINRKQTNK